jgi:hypothetical protein
MCGNKGSKCFLECEDEMDKHVTTFEMGGERIQTLI